MSDRASNGWTEESGKRKLGRKMHREMRALSIFSISRRIRRDMYVSHAQKRLKP